MSDSSFIWQIYTNISLKSFQPYFIAGLWILWLRSSHLLLKWCRWKFFWSRPFLYKRGWSWPYGHHWWESGGEGEQRREAGAARVGDRPGSGGGRVWGEECGTKWAEPDLEEWGGDLRSILACIRQWKLSRVFKFSGQFKWLFGASVFVLFGN